MAKQFDYEVKTTIRLNMHNPDHVLINNVIQNLDPKIFKSKNQFILDACKFYIDNYGSETFIAKKNDIVLPSEVGFDMPMYNLNGDKNIGWDASLKYNGSYKDLSYQIGGNVSFSRRKTTKVYNPIFSTSLNYYRDNTANRWEGGFWGYESAGYVLLPCFRRRTGCPSTRDRKSVV